MFDGAFRNRRRDGHRTNALWILVSGNSWTIFFFRQMAVHVSCTCEHVFVWPSEVHSSGKQTDLTVMCRLVTKLRSIPQTMFTCKMSAFNCSAYLMPQAQNSFTWKGHACQMWNKECIRILTEVCPGNWSLGRPKH